MKYLVTGAAGFIGSHIVDRLLADGHEVRALDDLSTGRSENMAGFRDKIEFIEGKVENPDTIETAIDGVDGIFHQAAIPSVPRSVANPLSTHRSIVDGTLTILEAMKKRCGGKIVLASSSSIYGESIELPKHEEIRPDPLSPYAAAKFSAENYAMVYARLYDVKAVALRYFNVFGPRQDPASEYSAVIPKFITAALSGKAPVIYGDGTQSRDFTYVENVVNANLLAMQKEVSGLRLNIAGGRQVTLLELVETIGKTVNRTVTPTFDPPRSGDIMHSFASIEAARQSIGYEPSVDIEAGIAKTVEFFEQ